MAICKEVEAKYPTYGELIDMFENIEKESPGDVHLLISNFTKSYPNVTTGRPGRFYTTVERIAIPTKPSLRGEAKIQGGSPLASYRRRLWIPRTRNAGMQAIHHFPEELHDYGLDEQLLDCTFDFSQNYDESRTDDDDLPWRVKGTPNTGFYKVLHPYLKANFQKATKTAIGKFYMNIDRNLKAKEDRPDNIYRFIERVAASQNLSPDRPMNYNLVIAAKNRHRKVVKGMETQLQLCHKQMEQMSSELSQLRTDFTSSRVQLEATDLAFRDIKNEASTLKQRFDGSRKRVQKLKSQCTVLERDRSDLESENFDLLSELEDRDFEGGNNSRPSELPNFMSTKSGNRYSPEIRKLYYSLLADEVPASKIESMIKSVLKCFHPSVNFDENFSLPKKTCANYMRRQELKTISDVHKATVLSDLSSKKKGLMLNTDGTTKYQKKLGGVVGNDVVLSLSELPDGSAASAVSEISSEFENLRKIARSLRLPNADSINWTLVVSSTADSASTQKKINKLIEDCRKQDEERFGCATVETIDLVESFCSMHLGINLRKAFLSGFASHKEMNTERKYHSVDILVHEFCKLFGKHGVPEYTLGVQSFPDFLKLMTTELKDNLSQEELVYYQACSNVTLHRQVGSRYFVSASNGCKILFLKNAAVEFLKFTGKSTGNKLEQSVFTKLQDNAELSQLMADSIMYYHVYADLYMLSKSTELEKSAFSMGHHYLELQLFLAEVIKDPAIAVDVNYHVFPSETRLYSDNKKVNHRIQTSFVYEYLFQECQISKSTLLPLLISGTCEMRDKLASYACNQLPGGIYWDPEPDVKDILCQLKPSNDICESVLGLNDYLTSKIPNLHQMSRSNLVEMKKNKTLSWLSEIPQKNQLEVIDLAVKERRHVLAESIQNDKQKSLERRAKMLQTNLKRKALEKKLSDEKELLLNQHIITSSEELAQALGEIDFEGGAASKRKAKKLSVLRTQIKIRKRILNQTIPIVFTHARKQIPLGDIVKELSEFIDANTCSSPYSAFLTNPETLVSKTVEQRFDDDGEMGWYIGTVTSYCSESKMHNITYEDDDGVYTFDLLLDLLNGDLRVLQ